MRLLLQEMNCGVRRSWRGNAKISGRSLILALVGLRLRLGGTGRGCFRLVFCFRFASRVSYPGVLTRGRTKNCFHYSTLIRNYCVASMFHKEVVEVTHEQLVKVSEYKCLYIHSFNGTYWHSNEYEPVPAV